MQIALALLLILALVVCWALNLLSLPGNWLAALVTATYWYFGPTEGVTAISGWIVIAVLVIAAAAETVEFLASSLGATKAGGSKRAALLALVGSVVGALVGATVGSAVVPVVGTILGALVGGGAGALMGAILGEAAKGKSSEESWQVGKAAFWGRIFGSLAKTIIGGASVAVVAVAVCC